MEFIKQVMKHTSQWFAGGAGAFFLLCGILGWIWRPLFGIFEVNGLRLVFYLIAGGLGIWAMAWGSRHEQDWYALLSGAVFLVVAIIGLAGIQPLATKMVLGGWSDLLHLLTGIKGLLIGFIGLRK